MRSLTRILILLCALLSALCASAAPLVVPLDLPKGFQPYSISAVGNGVFCMAGEITDKDDGTHVAMPVAVVDIVAKKTRWITSIPMDEDFVNGSARGCVTDGHAYYALSQATTYAGQGRSPGALALTRISLDGKLEKHSQLDIGFGDWVNSLSLQDGVFYIEGGSHDPEQRGRGEFSTFLAKYDKNFKQLEKIMLPTGAMYGEAVIHNDHLFVAGTFMPNNGAGSKVKNAFAISSINLKTRKYVWSKYITPNDIIPGEEEATFLNDGTAVYMALTTKGIIIKQITKNGRVSSETPIKSPLCSLDGFALTQNGKFILIGHEMCDKAHEDSHVIYSMDSRTKEIHSIGKVKGDLGVSTIDNGKFIAFSSLGRKNMILTIFNIQ